MYLRFLPGFDPELRLRLLLLLLLLWPDCLDSAMMFYCGLSVVFRLAGGMECC
jgi:hypothetical protein